MPRRIIDFVYSIMERIQSKSLLAAVKQQGLAPLFGQLSRLVPNISEQYSSFVLDSFYLKTKVRAQHAFQISMVENAFSCLNINPELGVTIVDIGDSSGIHLQYLHGLYRNIRALSVNLDEKAVEKIKNKGMEAIHARAENLKQYSVQADVFLSFEMLEHLSDPLQFLHSLSETECRTLVVTIPYLAESRIGLLHIRQLQRQEIHAETTHIFELSPEDWRLLFLHSGWQIIYDKIYYQFPRVGLWRLTKKLWKRTDFEGFYGAVLVRNNEWSKLYKDW